MMYLKSHVSKSHPAQPPHNPAQPPLEHQGSCGRRETSPHNPLGDDWAHTDTKMFTRVSSQVENISIWVYRFLGAFGGQDHQTCSAPEYLSQEVAPPFGTRVLLILRW